MNGQVIMPHSWSFVANQKVRNAIVGAENLLNGIIPCKDEIGPRALHWILV